ncbi:uncharacterized protein [Excalfactoria chinensis]|uniref:uncharacterized protein n=1 Tax=Excalfactoria chinensis TaxID=46218 RepID=UPI003B3A9EB0
MVPRGNRNELGGQNMTPLPINKTPLPIMLKPLLIRPVRWIPPLSPDCCRSASMCVSSASVCTMKHQSPIGCRIILLPAGPHCVRCQQSPERCAAPDENSEEQKPALPGTPRNSTLLSGNCLPCSADAFINPPCFPSSHAARWIPPLSPDCCRSASVCVSSASVCTMKHQSPIGCRIILLPAGPHCVRCQQSPERCAAPDENSEEQKPALPGTPRNSTLLSRNCLPCSADAFINPPCFPSSHAARWIPPLSPDCCRSASVCVSSASVCTMKHQSPIGCRIILLPAGPHCVR